MDNEFSRLFKNTGEFYFQRLKLIELFSIPFILAFLIPTLVPAPTYISLGGVFLRTGSIPELSMLDFLFTAAAYAVAVFIIADTIGNINIIIRAKRTMTSIGYEVLQAMGSYAMRIFYVYTLILLVLFILQLVTYENPLQPLIYSLVSFVLVFLLFFVPPAVVIDNSDTPTAIKRSITMALRNPHLVLFWSALSLLAVSIISVVVDLVVPSPYSSYVVLIANCLIILPYLTVLQTQMYMEKYPLSR